MTRPSWPFIKTKDDILLWLRNKKNSLATILLAINLIVMIVPLAPMMPSAQLDPSWMLGVNQALAQDLVFGRDFIFTIGPYGSLYTLQYHPATDFLMVSTAFALALGWAIALLELTAFRFRIALFLLSIFLLTANSHDLKLLGYPFLIMLWTVSGCNIASEKNTLGRLTVFAKLYAFSLLGLLPLVKLSTLPLCILATIMTFWFLLIQGQTRQAWFLLFTPLATMSIFWLMAGQPLTALPDYFTNGSDIIAGYSEAMAIPGKSKMPALYLLICLCLAATTLWSRNLTPLQKTYLLLSLSSFLFIVMKGSFVRHDGHALLAGTGVIFASAMTLFLIQSKSALAILGASLLLNGYISHHYREFQIQSFIGNITKSYIKAANGLHIRIFEPDKLNQNYKKALISINSTSSLPKVSGTSDIYSYEQSALIASSNIWSPRPIIQSYSAYTPKLAELNRQHLIGKNAADNIFFRVQPIDNRLPSTEDGPSWPAIMQGYEIADLYGDFIHLRKRGLISDTPQRPVLRQTIKIGTPFPIKKSTGGIYARLKLKKTLAGRLANLLYKTTSIQLLIETHDGNKKIFRFIPQMAEAGFILSPHIQTTTDFAWMASNHSDLLPQVKQITLLVDQRYQALWQPTVEIELQSFEVPVSPGSTNLPIGLSEKVASPTLSPRSACAAAIDTVDVRPKTGPAKLLNIMGWLVMDSKTGKAPDRVIITLRHHSGQTLYFANSMQHARPDVAAHLKTSPAALSGFTALINVKGFSGKFEISLSKQLGEKIEMCTSPTTFVSLK